jgi:hypothetical protein
VAPVAAAIAEQVEAAKRGAARIVMMKDCLNCGIRFSKLLPVATINRVGARCLVGDVGVDVALIGAEERVVGVICFDERRWLPEKVLKGLQQQSVPWIVAAPSTFLKERGNEIAWYPSRSSRPLCRNCAADRNLSQRGDGTAADEWTIRGRVIRRISLNTRQPVPERGSPYWAEPYSCWKCSTRILIYAWKGREWMSEMPPPDPRPETIQYRHSKAADDKYWVNVCPHCNGVQGDNYVFAPAGPLSRPAGTPLVG